MNVLRRPCCFLLKNLCSHRMYAKDYYDILQLNKNCSDKEIKDSFLQLSKRFHPDRSPNDPNSHGKFVQLNEAYSVLGKSRSRQFYDKEVLRRKHTNHPHKNRTPDGKLKLLSQCTT